MINVCSRFNKCSIIMFISNFYYKLIFFNKYVDFLFLGAKYTSWNRKLKSEICYLSRLEAIHVDFEVAAVIKLISAMKLATFWHIQTLKRAQSSIAKARFRVFHVLFCEISLLRSMICACFNVWICQNVANFVADINLITAATSKSTWIASSRDK